jgi:hypothetical protein
VAVYRELRFHVLVVLLVVPSLMGVSKVGGSHCLLNLYICRFAGQRDFCAAGRPAPKANDSCCVLIDCCYSCSINHPSYMCSPIQFICGADINATVPSLMGVSKVRGPGCIAAAL